MQLADALEQRFDGVLEQGELALVRVQRLDISAWRAA